MTQLCLRPDDELVALYKNGNNEAFDVLLDRYQDRLYSYILYIVHNADLADDLFQETFVRTIMTIRQGRYTANGKFYAYLTRIAHNLVIDQFRQERNENTISNDNVEGDLFNNMHLAEQDVEKQMVADQTLNDVRRLMTHLPDNQREVVYLRYYKNLSFKEISEQTGVSINTALGRMRYAILNMRKMVSDYDIAL